MMLNIQEYRSLKIYANTDDYILLTFYPLVRCNEYPKYTAFIFSLFIRALFGVLQMVPLVILPMVSLVANGTMGLYQWYHWESDQ